MWWGEKRFSASEESVTQQQSSFKLPSECAFMQRRIPKESIPGSGMPTLSFVSVGAPFSLAIHLLPLPFPLH
jgi:hypothetical protein